MKITRVALLLVLAGLFSSVVPTNAFRMIQTNATGRVTQGQAVPCNSAGGFVHWTTPNIDWSLNPAGQGSDKAGAITAALGAWNGVAGAAHSLTFAGTTNRGWATDNRNTVLWATGNGCTGSCLALTALVLQGGQVIVESDVTFNASRAWNTNGVDFDTQAVAAHEFGHSLGIHHTEVTSTPRPTMFATYFGTGGRSLTNDDQDALRCSQNRYPFATPPAPLRVTMSGPTSRSPNVSGDWSVNVSGGVAPYTYVWFKTHAGGVTELGGGRTKRTSHPTSFNMVCDVVDAAGNFGTAHIFVSVTGGGDGDLPF